MVTGFGWLRKISRDSEIELNRYSDWFAVSKWSTTTRYFTTLMAATLLFDMIPSPQMLDHLLATWCKKRLLSHFQSGNRISL